MKLEKTTKHRQKEEKRRFDDACGLAHALELLGERWAMLVLRELAYGPRRFSELVGMSPSQYRREESDTAAGMPSCVARGVTRPIREPARR